MEAQKKAMLEHREGKQDATGSAAAGGGVASTYRGVIAALNLVLVVIMLCTDLALFLQVKAGFFRRIYSWVDLLFIFLNVWIYYLYWKTDAEGVGTEQFERDVKMTRYAMAVGTLTCVTKFSYFFAIIDSIAPLYDIMTQIVYDIRYFMMILMIYTIAFATAFRFLA